MSIQAFLRACQEGNEAEVTRLLERDPALVNRRDSRGGWSGLMLSAKYGHACVVKQLLDAGADPLARNQFSASALHWAAVGGSLEIVEMLLVAAKRAATTIGPSDSPQQQPQPQQPHAAMALLNGADIFGTTSLIAASRHGQAGVVRRLLREQGCLVDARDKDGMTATWRVACWGKADVLALLITEGGADFGLPDKTGRLPIDVARDLDRHQCVGMLLEAERGYALWKARRLKEAALLSVGGGGKWAWWGEGRRALPRVEVLAAVEEEEEGGGEGDEEEEEGQEEENEEEEERRAAWARCVAVANLVVEELPLDVFQELSGYL